MQQSIFQELTVQRFFHLLKTKILIMNMLQEKKYTLIRNSLWPGFVSLFFICTVPSITRVCS